MIRALRLRASIHALAVAMQLCMAWMAVSSLLHVEDDALCNPVVAHDHAAHRIGQAPTDDTPSSDHCFTCHNLSLRSLVASSSLASPLLVEQPVAVASSRARHVAFDSRQPARAPPLS